MSIISFRKERYKYTDDIQMVADVIAGNEDALRYLLYVRFKVAFEVIFNNMVGNRKEMYKECDDLIQEFYLKLRKDDWKTLREYDRSKGDFVSWFVTSSRSVWHNHAMDNIKKELLIKEGSYKKKFIPMSDFDDEDRICSRMTSYLGQSYDSMYKSLMTVNDPPYRDFERDRRIFDSMIMHGENKAEVAKRFDVSERTVERSLKKIEGFVRLRVKLEKYF